MKDLKSLEECRKTLEELRDELAKDRLLNAWKQTCFYIAMFIYLRAVVWIVFNF